MSPNLVARIKFPKSSLSLPLEMRFVQKFGWIVDERGTDYVILKKPKGKPVSSAPAYPHSLEILDEISEERQKELNRRCQRVVDCFVEPEAHKTAIRKQLHNFGQRLPILEQQFVENWSFNNVL